MTIQDLSLDQAPRDGADATARTDGPERVETLIVGGGQAGLAMAYRLAERGRPFVIVDAHARIGDTWRTRWDGLRLFTPAGHDALPGLPLPGKAFRFPSKDEMADYLARYAEAFGLAVRTGSPVERLELAGGRYVARIRGGGAIEADNVVVATGAFQKPRVPAFAPDLDPGILQLHSSRYRNPDGLRDGAVLVVGPGNSGADIALELATAGRHTFLAGKHPGHLPIRTESWRGRMAFPLIWFVWTHILNIGTPVGRKVRPKILAGPEPLIRVKPSDLERAGVERTPRVAGVTPAGLPLLDDGRILDVPNVIWATGYRPDFSWIAGVELDERGEPLQDRGVVEDLPGLFFLGREFQFAFNSHTVGGVGRDAEQLAGAIAARVAA
jgi:putative flavoprotein involved in K+ transport